jgi:hypothetical protein
MPASFALIRLRGHSLIGTLSLSAGEAAEVVRRFVKSTVDV